MNEMKTVIRFFTVADYEDEELWLRAQHRAGWKMADMTPPCFYRFERCEPEDVIYRLDFKNGEQDEEYLRFFADYGWECFESCLGWLFFRKSAAAAESEEDGEIFSDNASRAALANKVVKTRILPVLIIFLTCLLPSLWRVVRYSEPAAIVFTVILSLFAGMYLFLLVHCGVKLARLLRKYGGR